MGKNSGLLVKTATGRVGRTYHSKGLINGKVPVYIDGESTPILCDMKKIKIIGYID